MTQKKIKVGILHSLTGTMAISEKAVAESEIMAIDEINNKGGIEIDGEKYIIEYLLEDGESNDNTFAKKAEKLIKQDNVSIVFGGWTSSSRNAMRPVFEKENHLLYYPIQYEGEEFSPNIFYAGATPNQQSEPATEFMFKKSPSKGKPFFLVGSDYVFPRISNKITKAQMECLCGKIAGEMYIPIGSTKVSKIVKEIKKTLPTGGTIINTLNGESNIAFFKELKKQGITPSNKYYIMSYSIAENEIKQIGPELLKGHYGSWNYMMSIDSKLSKKFVNNFQTKYGKDRVVGDPQESAYNMVYLWKKAVEKSNSFNTGKVRKSLIGVEINAPQGKVKVDSNHHLFQKSRIGKIQKNGQYKILETSKKLIKPQNFSKLLSDGCEKDCGLKSKLIPIAIGGIILIGISLTR